MVKLVQKLRMLQNTKDWKAQIPAWMRILVQGKKKYIYIYIMKFIPLLEDAKRRKVHTLLKNKLVVKGQINDLDYLLKIGPLYDRRNGYP